MRRPMPASRSPPLDRWPRSPDRSAADAYQPDPTLLAAAQKEGEVLFYTTQIVDQIVRPLIKEFQTLRSGRAASNMCAPTACSWWCA